MSNILRFISNIKIRQKLLLGYVTAFVLLLTVVGVILYPIMRRTLEAGVESELSNSTKTILSMVKTSTDASIKNYLRAIAEKNRDIVSYYYQQSTMGLLTEKKAREQAGKALLSQTIGKTGYIFVWDVKNAPKSIILAVHPKIQGEDVAYVDFVQEGARLKNGYMEYQWKNPKEENTREKAMYLSYFKPWGWVIAASSYKEEFMTLINVDYFRDSILSLKFGKTGYPYILDSRGNVIVHPLLTGNIYDVRDSTGRQFVQEMCKEKNGKIIYTWRNPGEKEFREKLTIFNYIPSLDWIVASSSYLEEFYEPLNHIRNILIAIFIVSLVFLFLLTFGYSTYFVKNLNGLIHAFRAGSNGDLTVRIVNASKDEFGSLSEYFNDFMEKLNLSHQSLHQEIQERRQAEEALRESEVRYREIFENANEAIFVAQDGKIAFYNPKTTDVVGYSGEELTSRPFVEFINPDDRKMVLDRHNRRVKGEEFPHIYPFRIIHGDGSVRWVELNTVVVTWTGKPATLNFLYDITDRMSAEEEKRSLEERLQRSEKMDALGQLAGGVAHDLNNVLGVLSGYSELLLREIPKGQKARSYVEKILQSTEKGATIIQDLLTLARRGVVVADVINLNAIIEGFLTTPVFERIKDYHPRVTFRAECADHLMNIRGSSVHLEKTAMNLVANAAEAISGEGEVVIRTENRYLDRPLRGYDEIREGDYVVLTVSDTGMGISAEDQERIFEPFYTKKKMGRSGTGLGLAIVWGTVKDNNGYINVRSAIDEGTTFTLYFPATREDMTADPEAAPLESYMGRGESVLVVDDIADQRDVAAGLLKTLGYQVHVASSGEEAVEYLKGNKADILVLDMIMEPGIDGMETYRQVLEINPKQKAILVSGFSETERAREARKLGAGAYVKKPYILEKIGMAIRDELNR